MAMGGGMLWPLTSEGWDPEWYLDSHFNAPLGLVNSCVKFLKS